MTVSDSKKLPSELLVWLCFVDQWYKLDWSEARGNIETGTAEVSRPLGHEDSKSCFLPLLFVWYNNTEISPEHPLF
jgi:hypothetical protein